MKSSAILTCLVLGYLCTGCASVTKGTTQTMQVKVSNCSDRMNCQASNKKGTWFFTVPGPLHVQKSDDPLMIRCEDVDSVLTRHVIPDRGSAIWGNILLGGAPGAVADAITDAHWELPDTVTLVRESCRSQQLEGSEKKPAAQPE